MKMNTKDILSAAGLLLASLTQAQERPNVIFIYADDMGKGMMSVYGQKQFKTPNMDKLVNQGVSFANAYGCHYSAPARASLLTGYSDCHHKGNWLQTFGPAYAIDDTAKVAPLEKKLDKIGIVLPKGDDYLAQIFQHAGYYTGEIGKLDYGFVGTRSQTKAHGWDYFYGYLDHGRCHGFYPSFLFENDKIVLIEGNTRADAGCMNQANEYDEKGNYRTARWEMKGKKLYSQDIFEKKITEFIRLHKDKPFFLYHPSQLPHGPVAVPEIDPQVKTNANLNDLEKEYASMIIRLDKTIGVILNELDRQGLTENTILVFSSDNGHYLHYKLKNKTSLAANVTTGEKFDNYKNKFRSEAGGDVFNGNRGMAGLKRSNLEGGVHVPLTFYWKGHLKPAVQQSVVSNYDFLPTMADLLDVSVTANKDGISYYPLLVNGNQNIPTNRYVLVDSKEGPAIIMNNGWKLRFTGGKARTFELFNLREDPKEMNNLADQYPTKVETMKSILKHETTFSECVTGYPTTKDSFNESKVRKDFGLFYKDQLK